MSYYAVCILCVLDLVLPNPENAQACGKDLEVRVVMVVWISGMLMYNDDSVDSKEAVNFKASYLDSWKVFPSGYTSSMALCS
jgi:hypothetical protein